MFDALHRSESHTTAPGVGVIESARKVVNSDIKYSIVQRRVGDPATLVASSEKAKQVLGWMSKYVSLGDIIETAYNGIKDKEKRSQVMEDRPMTLGT